VTLADADLREELPLVRQKHRVDSVTLEFVGG
jgi:hypothetical protein